MSPNPQETADLVTFTEEILNGKHFFFCSVITFKHILKSIISESFKYIVLTKTDTQLFLVISWSYNTKHQWIPLAYSEPCQTSCMEPFA